MAKRSDEISEANTILETTTEESRKTISPSSNLYLLVLVPLIALSSGVGAWLAYSHYPQLLSAVMHLGFQSVEESDSEANKPIEYGEFIEMSDVIVNPAGSGGKRILLLSLGLESKNTGVLEEITSREIVVRDTILKVVGQYTVDELADIGRRNEIKDQIRGAVNSILKKGQVDRTYLTRWVLQ